MSVQNIELSDIQLSKVIWFSGLSGAGKTTLAERLNVVLKNKGIPTVLIDNDTVRGGLNKDLTFSISDRYENIRRVAHISKIIKDNGVFVICCFITPLNAMRENARGIIGTQDFLDIHLSTPFAVCEQRDVKGLFQQARNGKIKDFSGLDSPFENPLNPYIQLDTEQINIEDCMTIIMNKLNILLNKEI